MDIFGLKYDQVFGDTKEVIDPRWGVTPREMMQRLGSFVREVHTETWVRKTFDTITAAQRGEDILLHIESLKQFAPVKPSTQRWCITDVRHTNEADAVRAHGGVILKVHRPSIALDAFSDHESEASVDLIEPDHLIVNDGTLGDLKVRVHDTMCRMGINS
jgi:hypothetical protein